MVHLPYFLPDDWSDGIEDEPVAAGHAAVPRRGRSAGADEGVPAADPADEAPARGRPPDRRDRPLRDGAPRPGRRGCRTSSSRGCSAARRWPGSSTGRGPSSCRRSSPRRSATSSWRRSRSGRRSSSTGGAGRSVETGVLSGGGLGYETDAELLVALRRVVHDEELRSELAEAGFAMRQGAWSEESHLRTYFDLIQTCRRGTRRVDASRQASGANRCEAGPRVSFRWRTECDADASACECLSSTLALDPAGRGGRVLPPAARRRPAR